MSLVTHDCHHSYALSTSYNRALWSTVEITAPTAAVFYPYFVLADLASAGVKGTTALASEVRWWVKKRWCKATGWVSAVFPSVMQHFQLGRTKGIQAITNLCYFPPPTISTKILVQKKWRKKSKQEPANSGSPGKWPSEWRTTVFHQHFTQK